MSTPLPHSLPRIIGHRGSSQEAPENTLESFRLAWEQDADGIEADFRLTADGRIVCMHDETTARTAEVGLNVAESTLDGLRSLDVGLWKGKQWSGVRVPTLDEILVALPRRSWFFIEIKCGAEIIPPLKRVLQKSGVSPEYIRLLAFSAPLIAELKRNLPGWKACWLCDYRHSRVHDSWHPSHEEVLQTLQQCRADGLASANREFLDGSLVQKVRGVGGELHVWTVDRLPDAQRLCSLGVDSLMTNRPGWLRRHLTATGPRP